MAEIPKFLEQCAKKLQRTDADAFEIYFQAVRHLQIEVQNGKRENLTQSTDQGIAIRVLKNQKMGFAYSLDFSKDGLEKMISSALQIAELMPEDKYATLPSFAAQVYPTVDACDEGSVLEKSIELKTELALQIEAAARNSDTRVKRVRKAGLSENLSEVYLLDSHCEALHHKQTYFTGFISCVAESNGQAEIGHDSFTSPFLDQLVPEKIGQEAAHSACELLGSRGTSTKKCPVVFKNEVVSELLDFLSASFSGENIEKNLSLFAGKLGKKVASELLTITDDGLLAGGVGSWPFDAEGTPQQKTVLLESGWLSKFLTDQTQAKKMGTKSTGNSSRGGIKAPPQIGTTNLVLKPGKKSLDALLKQAHQGVLITKVLGMHTANPVTGEFSLGASGIEISSGGLSQPIKGFTIAGNIFDVLGRIEALGSDFRLFGSTGASSLFLSELSIGGNST